MNSIRQWINERPAAGWGLAGVLLLVVVFWFWRSRQVQAYDLERLSEMVTVRDRDTGQEFQMRRGEMERMLWDRPGQVDPSQGIPNPETGTNTCFPKSEWERTVERINAEKNEIATRKGGAGHK